METKKINLIVLLVLLFVCRSFSAEKLTIIPQPQSVKFTEGFFEFKSGKIAAFLADVSNREDLFAFADLKKVLQDQFQIELTKTKDKKAAQFFLISDFKKIDRDLFQKKWNVDIDENISDEGYYLFIDKKQVVALGKSSTGLFYAIQTLKQIIRQQQGEKRLPCLVIKDFPTLKIRGVLDDISRGPIPTMEFFKRNIVRFAELKFNALVYYTEHVVRTKKHGDFAPPDALTLEEIRELDKFARKYHIELVGCFQSFGHFEKILEFPQYEHLGEMSTLLTPTKKESYQLLSDIYSEVVPAYSSKNFCVLCDETWGLGKGASKEIVEKRGIEAVYADHVNWIQQELAKYGKRAWVAADVALQHQKILDLLDHRIILLPWNYSPRDSFADMLEPIRERSFDFIVTTGVSCSRRIFPALNTSLVNIKNFIRDGIRYGTSGNLTTAWDGFGLNFFSNNWFGLAYAAEKSWTGVVQEDGDFFERFTANFYGDDTGMLSSALKNLASMFQFSELQGLEWTVFFKKIIPEAGKKAQLPETQWNEIREIARQTLDYLSRAKIKFHRSDLDYLKFATKQIELMADFRLQLLSAAEKYREACLHQSDREKTKETVNLIYSDFSQLAHRWGQMREEYRKLWLGENRKHWLDVNLEKFDRMQRDIEDVLLRLKKAVAQFESGYYLPSPLEVRLAVKPLTEKFFRTWLLCGSFPNPKKNSLLPSHVPNNCVGFDTDYLEEIGGERAAHPIPGELVKRPDGSVVEWKVVTSNLGAKMDLSDKFDKKFRVVAYAYCTIFSPKADTVTAGLGSNDGIKVFVNGKKIFQVHELRLVKIDDNVIKLPLRKGENHILLKIDQGRGRWGFCFRIIDRKFRNEGYRYEIGDW
ncbi:MAG: hypothetical protein GXO74_10405 [Calditrichaeota bacterium]|nr:hypothetical protein [Calditrichota bacterium]